MGRKRTDLTNRRFGLLVALKRVEDYISPKGQHLTQWLCECDCGNETIVIGNSLTRELTKSCGCLRKEATSINHKKYNAYDLSGEYGIGYTSKGEEFYFDLEDYDKIKDYCWFIDKHGYVITNRYNKDIRNCMKMHRLVTNCPKEFDVDHKHGKETKNDNRKENLRIATRSQNNMNKELKSDNTSGATGISWYKPRNKWRVQITINHKTMHIGYFDEFEDAFKARKEAEEKYFGEWSYNNSQMN